TALAVQADGKLVASGSAFLGTDQVFATVRFDPSGGLDAAFGQDGRALAAMGSDDTAGNCCPRRIGGAHAVAALANGKIVVAGNARTWRAPFGTYYSDLGVLRYLSNGTLDPSFGSGGAVMTPLGHADGPQSIVVQPDGRVLVAGPPHFTVVRYLGDPPPGGGPARLDAPEANSGPRLERLSLRPRRFRAARRGPAIVSSVGTVVRFRLDVPASTALRAERLLPGRRRGRSCVSPRGVSRRARGCTRVLPVRGSAVHRGHPGVNRLRFSGRLGGRTLAPGRYRLVLVATDGSGMRSRPARAAFRIVR
ncbi:MAG: hypothetical protein M3N16_04275, partial [Actinomycetota bacterium]|nr:hypothetical protein [Actinomycetota bacterium]